MLASSTSCSSTGTCNYVPGTSINTVRTEVQSTHQRELFLSFIVSPKRAERETMPTRFLEPVPAKHNGGSSGPPGTVAPQSLATRAPPQQPVVPAVGSTALKLSIGGVEFCLLPSTSGNGNISLEAAVGDAEAVLSLKNFTGTLRVTCTSLAVGNAGLAASKNISNNLVEDSASPSADKQSTSSKSKGNNSVNAPPPLAGQQQILAWTQTVANRGKGTGDNNDNESSHKRKDQISSPDALEVVAPIKRSRKSKDTTSNENNTANKQKNTVSPQTGQPQTSVSPCSNSDASSQTRQLPINCSKQTTKERIVDSVSGKDITTKHDEEDNESVATTMAGNTETEDREAEETDNRSSHNGFTMNSQSQLSITVEDDSSDNDIEIATDVALVESNVSTAITDQVVTPFPRWGHTMTWCEHNRILLYGGQSYLPNKNAKKKGDGEVVPTTMSDVHIFDVDKQKWFQPINCDDLSRQWPRQWHSATFLPLRQLLICFGGKTLAP